MYFYVFLLICILYLQMKNALRASHVESSICLSVCLSACSLFPIKCEGKFANTGASKYPSSPGYKYRWPYRCRLKGSVAACTVLFKLTFIGENVCYQEYWSNQESNFLKAAFYLQIVGHKRERYHLFHMCK